MAINSLCAGELVILTDSLLQTVKAKDARIKKITIRQNNESNAASLLRRFLVEEHPELTSEFAAFVLRFCTENPYQQDRVASGGLCAIEYHRDTINNKELDDVVLEIDRMIAKENYDQ